MSKGDIVIEDCGSLPQLIRVELPCFMRDKDKVLECLGGEDIVNESLMGDSNFLHASLAPQESPPRYVFKAKPVISNGFLVRIRRKKKRSPSDNDNEATVSVLGHVAKSYIFDRPVGCQVNSHLHFKAYYGVNSFNIPSCCVVFAVQSLVNFPIV